MAKLKLWRALVLLLTCSLSTQLNGQELSSSMSMTLEECLEYAKENSITLQRAKLEIENSQSEELSARGAFLPTISGSVSQGLSSYPLNDDSSLSSGNYTGSYGLDLSMTLYNGGKNRAQLQQSQLGEEIANLEMSEFENSLELSITEIYVEILYSIEQIKVAQSSVELNEQNEERGRAFLEVGSINEADMAQLESATATSRYNIVTAQTQLSNLYVGLKHLLEISYDMTITVVAPDLSDETLLAQIPTVSDVYEAALDTRPEIQSSKLYIESAELSTTIAKSGYLPTLRLTAGTGINHSSTSDYAFSSQLRNNFSTSAGLNLSIPIFTNYTNKSAVAIAQNNEKSAALSLTEAQKELYQTIETLRNNAANAQAKFSVSEYALQATLKSMELTQEQYRVGLKNTIELLTEQDNYNQTYQEHLTNKYQLILNKALLNYYKTDIIKL
ncbi:MAG: TolC family protein [Rikenellaceae bacterium]